MENNVVLPVRPPPSYLSQVMPDGFTRVIGFIPAFDFRGIGDGRYGQHVAEFHFALTGPLGAVSMRVFSGWDHALPSRETGVSVVYGQGAGIFWHRKVDASVTGSQPCEYCGHCVDSGASFLDSDPIFAALVREGAEVLWQILREAYDEHSWTEDEDGKS